MQQGWMQCPTCYQATAPGYACQRCGAAMQMPMGVQPQAQSSGMGVGVIIAIVVGVVVLLGGCVGVGALFFVLGVAEESSSSYSPPPYSPPATTTTTVGGGSGGSGATRGVGDKVTIDDSEWIVLDTKDLGKSINATSELFADEKKNTTGRFIQIHYRVTNNGKKQETLLDTPVIIDQKSRELGPIPGESEYVPKGTKTAILETLQPSISREFYTIIEVPKDATDLELQLTGPGLTGDKKRVDLNL